MATIQSQLRLNDGMSAVLRQVTAALDMCLASYEQIQATSQQAMDISNITAARVGLSEANAVIDEMASDLQRVSDQQHGLNRAVQTGISAFDGLLGKVGQMAAAYMSVMQFQKAVSLSDTLAGINARLSLIVDDGGSVADLEAKIFASAQRSRGSYTAVLDTVSKLGLMAGDAFSGNDEMIRFAQLMNQNFIIAGASATEQTSAMYQLTQAMAAGKLQGDEYRSIIENAPLLANSIEDYMRNVQRLEGSMKDWASEGLLTADVIKAALFSSADEIEQRFAQMPMTWEQIWTGMANSAILVLQPLLTQLNELANDPRAQGLVSGLLGALNALVIAAVPVIDFLVNGATAIADNWDLIAPVIFGLAAAWGVYTIAVNWATIAETAQAIWVGITTAGKIAATAATWMFTSATLAQAGAQHGLNAALYACPLVWILLIIIAVIAAIYLVVAAINHVTGSTVSATGIIAGAVMWLLALIGNIVIGTLNAIIQYVWTLFVEPFIGIIEWVLNATNGGFNSFGDGVANLIGNIISWFLSLGKVVTKIIDAIFGTNWTAGLSSLQNDVLAWGKNENAITLDRAAPTIDYRFDMTDAFDAGYNWGANIEQQLGGMFDVAGTVNPNGSLLDGIGSNLTDIANNTGSTAASLKNMSEDLVYMRDIAEREAINRFTTAEVHVDMSGMTNRLDSSVDVDGVIRRFVDGITEALDVTAEGVHA